MRNIRSESSRVEILIRGSTIACSVLVTLPLPAQALVQAFNWISHHGDYYARIVAEAQMYADMGFTYVWLPPPTASVSPEGYMPTDYFNLNSGYGTEEGLRAAVRALKDAGLKVAGDCVLNHRCALHQDDHGIWNKVRSIAASLYNAIFRFDSCSAS
jgi:maltooligosyltrehalose synthase